MTTENIQDEIERTRDEMATTLSAIERKLSPRQIMDQAVDTMRELASDQSRIGNIVRDNPIPLALIGLGIGWLAIAGTMSRRQSGSGSGSYESMEGVGSAWGGTADLSGSGGATYGYAPGAEASGYAGTESATHGSAGSAAQYAAGGNGQSVRDKASQLAHEASERASRATAGARQRVSQWSRSARSSASQAADRTWENYQQHPLTMGLVALMAGAALGALLPTSRRERELMSGTADELISRARDTGSEVMDKAARAVQAAKEEIRHAPRDEKEGPPLAGSSSTMTH